MIVAVCVVPLLLCTLPILINVCFGICLSANTSIVYVYMHIVMKITYLRVSND